jgi:hypothetical protein
MESAWNSVQSTGTISVAKPDPGEQPAAQRRLVTRDASLVGSPTQS